MLSIDKQDRQWMRTGIFCYLFASRLLTLSPLPAESFDTALNSLLSSEILIEQEARNLFSSLTADQLHTFLNTLSAIKQQKLLPFLFSMVAMYSQDTELLSLLISLSPLIPPDMNPSLVHLASLKNSSVDMLHFLINITPSSVLTDNEQLTPLHLAAMKNPNPQIIRLLVESGSTVNEALPFGFSPLHLAVQTNHNLQISSTLMELGAWVDIPSYKGQTPLHRAALFASDESVLTVLLDWGASPDILDDNNKRAVDYALLNENLVDTNIISRLE